MRKLLTAVLTMLTALSLGAFAGQSTTGEAKSKTEQTASAAPPRKRGPVFRATKEQITQAQNALKQQGHYAGESTGKLDDATRAGLKKFQAAAGLKETGTLNRVTLERMNIALTEKQKTM